MAWPVASNRIVPKSLAAVTTVVPASVCLEDVDVDGSAERESARAALVLEETVPSLAGGT